ncbi:hypothetical protein [Bradyrhizobium sp. Tv2a-2]|uniref:hypothetical protein n=1 Tax=Bradyrhizobium sp. Tv2a-2 TaxID=113395 RepID=UPI0003F8D51D|nr:hypothetical protein [Bradyrhizobium sp. Tv2a-2]
MSETKDLRRQLRELRSAMRVLGIRKISPFNGGLDRDTYQYNARRFELETRLKIAERREANEGAT